MEDKRRKILKYIRIIVYIVLIISLVLLKYTDLIQSECHIKKNIGILCPSCGMTRAMKGIVNFDLNYALENNAYAILVLLPIFVVLFVDDVICMIFKKKSLVEIILGE